jgi:hypothetical protein
MSEPAPVSLDWAYQRGFQNGYARGREAVCPPCGRCVQDAGVVVGNNSGEESREAFAAGYAVAMGYGDGARRVRVGDAYRAWVYDAMREQAEVSECECECVSE